MRLSLPILLTLLFLSFSCYATDEQEGSTPSEEQQQSTFDKIAALFREFAVEYGGLTEENAQTLDDIIASIKKTLNDPNPAASVKVEGKTKEQWDDLNTSSPALEEKNQQLKEENMKRIENM